MTGGGSIWAGKCLGVGASLPHLEGSGCLCTWVCILVCFCFVLFFKNFHFYFALK